MNAKISVLLCVVVLLFASDSATRAQGVQFTASTDSQWIALNKFSAPANVLIKPFPIVRINAIEGLNSSTWRLKDALDTQYGKDNYQYHWAYEVRPGYGMVRNRIMDFPNDWQSIYNNDIVVDLGAGVGQGLSRETRCMIEEWVKDGGGLLILGGYWTFGSGGGWAGTTFDDLSPVLCPPSKSLWDWNSQFYPLSGPQPAINVPRLQGREPVDIPPPSPVGSPMVPSGNNPLTDGLSWDKKPIVMVAAIASGVKLGATVLVTADNTPIVVAWHYGKGRVVAVLAQPLGETQPGATDFWNWQDWPVFLGRLIDWLKPQK